MCLWFSDWFDITVLHCVIISHSMILSVSQYSYPTVNLQCDGSHCSPKYLHISLLCKMTSGLNMKYRLAENIHRVQLLLVTCLVSTNQTFKAQRFSLYSDAAIYVEMLRVCLVLREKFRCFMFCSGSAMFYIWLRSVCWCFKTMFDVTSETT